SRRFGGRAEGEPCGPFGDRRPERAPLEPNMGLDCIRVWALPHLPQRRAAPPLSAALLLPPCRRGASFRAVRAFGTRHGNRSRIEEPSDEALRRNQHAFGGGR